MFIDSHAHLSSKSTHQQSDDMVARAKLAGIEAIINICTHPEDVERGLSLAQRHSMVYNCASTTPHDALDEGEKYFEIMAAYAKSGRLVAIGETGLDYFYYEQTKDIQKSILIKYLQLALNCNLPIVIHCRDAFADFFDILDNHYINTHSQYGPGVLHCFTGSIAEAHEVINRGFYLSLSGIVTYPKSQELREVAKIVPLDKLLIETDTPYLAPQSKRGKQNEPSFITETARVIADARNITLAELAAATTDNAKRLFNLKT